MSRVLPFTPTSNSPAYGASRGAPAGLDSKRHVRRQAVYRVDTLQHLISVQGLYTHSACLWRLQGRPNRAPARRRVGRQASSGRGAPRRQRRWGRAVRAPGQRAPARQPGVAQQRRGAGAARRVLRQGLLHPHRLLMLQSGHACIDGSAGQPWPQQRTCAHNRRGAACLWQPRRPHKL